ncbi:hypothetical protein FE257_006909 [Aspergillus nanangensis]|uniref:Zn(2)-C6 fungal-type domain-containing protein n=1 Tax=Aspergillus nanangensis TaxID=2582783 RepID=A0AAD4CNJ8_ASPNN|nr:hypothetical protein FE257_006909 [Aspergillus nanangensis]
MSTPSDNYTIHKVSLKRTRQACGPCRRKKARCPGEKPICSLCQRLGQRCTYGAQAALTRAGRSRTSTTPDQPGSSGDSHQSEHASHERFQRIEDRLDRMATLLEETVPKFNSFNEASSRSPSNRQGNQDELQLFGSQNQESDMPWSSFPPDYLQSEIQTYLTYFHDQPYCVFSRDWLLRHAGSLPPEIALPLVALTTRFSRQSAQPGFNLPTPSDCANKAWDILSNKYQGCELGLSFLQGTFLMAQVDFADGRSQRGYASVALGIRTLQSAGLNKDKYKDSFSGAEMECRKRIAWSFFMLDRHYNASRDYSVCLSDKHFTLSFPSLSATGAYDEGEPVNSTLHDVPKRFVEKADHGILSCLIRLSSIWGKVTEYVFEPFDTGSLLPWQSGSTFAVLESDWLQFQTHFADTHRYINVDYRQRSREEPHSHPYLSTWMCVQFLFHSVQGLLHHPFVTMVKLHQMEGNIPSTFLQKSYESSLIHSRWIARFIREMDDANLRLHDPFIGYLAAIAATSQLEHTLCNNQQVALLAKEDFKTLVDFVTRLSLYWDNMRVLVDRVRELASRRKSYGSLYYNQDGFSGALPRMPTSSNIPKMSAEDEELMWDILDFSSLSRPCEISRLGDLIPAQDRQMDETNVSHSRANSMTATTEVVQDQLGGRRPSLPPQFSTPGVLPLTRADSIPIADDSISGWPFSNRTAGDALGPAIPDIPDWMLFTDYVPEQL